MLFLKTGAGFTSKRGTFSNVAPQDTMLSVAFGRSAEAVFAGGENGSIYCFEGCALKRVLKKAHEGPVHALCSLEKVLYLSHKYIQTYKL